MNRIILAIIVVVIVAIVFVIVFKNINMKDVKLMVGGKSYIDKLIEEINSNL